MIHLPEQPKFIGRVKIQNQHFISMKRKNLFKKFSKFLTLSLGRVKARRPWTWQSSSANTLEQNFRTSSIKELCMEEFVGMFFMAVSVPR